MIKITDHHKEIVRNIKENVVLMDLRDSLKTWIRQMLDFDGAVQNVIERSTALNCPPSGPVA